VLLASLFVNLVGALALVNVIQGRGGIQYIQSLLGKGKNETSKETGEVAKAHLLSLLPIPDERPIVFVGDSLTAGCEWQELLGYKTRILNRGNGGDTSAGVLKRISDVSKLQPRAVFLMIGTDDRQMAGLTPEDTISNIHSILHEIERCSPDTKIYLESVLPSRTPQFVRWTEQVNGSIRLFEDESVTFLDLHSAFFDADHLLSHQYTHDGLHLNAAGYLLWKQHLDPLVERLTIDCP
jgi:lysophospholipase L1-like esterase